MSKTSISPYWNANLGGDALRDIRAILVKEQIELERLRANSSPTFLAIYPPGQDPSTLNIAKVDRIIADIDSIIDP